MRRRFCTIVLVVLALAVLAATPASAQIGLPYVTESCLTPALPSNQQAPSVTRSSREDHEQLVAFEDDRTGNWDIYISDLWTPWEQQLTTDPGAQRRPSASGRWVAYEDDRNGNWEIYLFDLESSAETRVTSHGAAQQDPSVGADLLDDGRERSSNALVAWEDDRSGNWDIYAYDVRTKTTTRVSSSAAKQVDPAVEDFRVVWADRRNGNWDIYLYDAVKKTTTRLTANGADQMAPAIQGTMVVYQDDRNGNWDIYGYDLATKKERRLTRNSADQTAPALSPRRESNPMIPGWRVVYQDARNGGADIYLSDIPAGGEFRLTEDAADQLAPSIWGDRVVWTDLRDTSSGPATADVYAGDLSFPYLDADLGVNEVPYDGGTTIGGVLETIGGAKVVRFLRVGANDRATTASAVTAVDGAYTMNLANLKQTTRYRTIYRGDATHLPAASNVVTLKVRASLSTPKIPKTFGYTKTVTVSCSLKPRHKAGSYPVKFQFYRYYRPSGAMYPDWYLVKTAKGKATNYSTYTKCSAAVKFPKPSTAPASDRYRVVAVHKDATHAETVSAYRAFTVSGLVVVVPIVP